MLCLGVQVKARASELWMSCRISRNTVTHLHVGYAKTLHWFYMGDRIRFKVLERYAMVGTSSVYIKVPCVPVLSQSGQSAHLTAEINWFLASVHHMNSTGLFVHETFLLEQSSYK